MMVDIEIPSRLQFLHYVAIFERRDAMYKVATYLVSLYWGQPRDMADALGVLLLTWNQAWYRYGSFDFDKLEQCIAVNLPTLQRMRKRTIFMLNHNDAGFIAALQHLSGTTA